MTSYLYHCVAQPKCNRSFCPLLFTTLLVANEIINYSGKPSVGALSQKANLKYSLSEIDSTCIQDCTYSISHEICPEVIIALGSFQYTWWRHKMETFSALPVNSPHKGQWRGALMFSLIYTWTNSWVNDRYSGDMRRQPTHYDVTAMQWDIATVV